MKTELLALKGKVYTKSFQLVDGQKVTLGRGADADIRINDPGISRQHARIVVTGAPGDPTISIEDAGSTNGILVNGERVRSALLTEGSRIEMGNTRLLVRTPVHDV